MTGQVDSSALDQFLSRFFDIPADTGEDMTAFLGFVSPDFCFMGFLFSRFRFRCFRRFSEGFPKVFRFYRVFLMFPGFQCFPGFSREEGRRRGPGGTE